MCKCKNMQVLKELSRAANNMVAYPVGMVLNDFGDNNVDCEFIIPMDFPCTIFLLYPQDSITTGLIPVTINKTDDDDFFITEINHDRPLLKSSRVSLKKAIFMITAQITDKATMRAVTLANLQQFETKDVKPMFTKKIAKGTQLTQSENDRLSRKSSP